MELEKELEKAKKDFMELISKELGIPSDLMSKGAVEVENAQARMVGIPKIAPSEFRKQIEKTQSIFDEIKEEIDKKIAQEQSRQDKLLILQILWVYETGIDFYHYKSYMLKLREMAENNPDSKTIVQMLTMEQVQFINSIKGDTESVFSVFVGGKN